MRIIICGSSPRIKDVPIGLLESGRVMGLNQTPELNFVRDYMDYWICWDDKEHTLNEMTPSLVAMMDQPIIKFLPNTDPWKILMPENMTRGTIWYERGTNTTRNDVAPIPEWRRPLELICYGSVVTPAVNLACLIGAREIILVGVDFYTSERFNGAHSGDGRQETMDIMADNANKFFASIKKIFNVRIYKTFEESPLQLPMFKLSNYQE